MASDPSILLVIIATFLLAGAIKGVIGLGLPTVSLALLTVAIDLPSAMALLLVPSFVTNFWQALVGGRAREILLRLWPIFVQVGDMGFQQGCLQAVRSSENQAFDDVAPTIVFVLSK